MVEAVWNGKEALDYLLEAETPGSSHFKPDIILMDVQMPIIDGYRATHLIRHHAPYSTLARNVPIVAMTASAIQGDREKCKKAGMDDYLAKPVKGKTLEKMLVRWALSRRVPLTPGDHDSSDCSETGEHSCDVPEIPIFGNEKSSSKEEADLPQKSTNTILAEHQNSRHMTLPSPESEADRAERRETFEEKATALRDDKLVEAAGGLGAGLVPHEARSEGHKLTIENVGKLERESVRMNSSSHTSLDSIVRDKSEEDSDVKKRGTGRPATKWRDSDATVRGRGS